MTTAVLRKELQGYIADMPEQSLCMLKPLLSGFSRPVAEPASEEEAAMIDGAMKDYENNPSCFTGWEAAKKELGLS
jgi:hypothetical protein